MPECWICSGFKCFLGDYGQMHKKEENVIKNIQEVQPGKKVTMNMSSILHQCFMQMVMDEHKSVHGHFNRELVNAVEYYLVVVKKRKIPKHGKNHKT